MHQSDMHITSEYTILIHKIAHITLIHKALFWLAGCGHQAWLSEFCFRPKIHSFPILNHFWSFCFFCYFKKYFVYRFSSDFITESCQIYVRILGKIYIKKTLELTTNFKIAIEFLNVLKWPIKQSKYAKKIIFFYRNIHIILLPYVIYFIKKIKTKN